LYRFGIVVLSLIQFSAATSALGFVADFGNVIAFAAILANSSAAQTVEKQRLVYVDVDNEVEVGDFIKRLSLRNRAREAVEHVTVFAVLSADAFLYDLASHFVGNEKTLVDVRFCKQPDGGLIFNVFSENVTRGDVGKLVGIYDSGSLRALTCTRRTEQNNVHIATPLKILCIRRINFRASGLTPKRERRVFSYFKKPL
jgi:hypothetical protein